MTFKRFFHIISYLQYPLMAIALYYAFKPYIDGLEQIKEHPDLYFESVNVMLLFMGLGLSFSSLQDTTKTQNKWSRKVYEDPIKGKIMIFTIILMITFALVRGLLGFFIFQDNRIHDLSIGLIVLGLGMFGFLKAGVELFENHRKDKNLN